MDDGTTLPGPVGNPQVNGEVEGLTRDSPIRPCPRRLYIIIEASKSRAGGVQSNLPYLQLNTLPNYKSPHLRVLFQFLTVELNPSGFSFVELLVVIRALSGKND